MSLTISNNADKALAVFAGLSLILSGCTVQSAPTETITVQATETSQENSETEQTAPVVDLTVPDLVGANTSDAEDELEELGFISVNSQDASSEERLVLLTTNWVVCEVIPAPGTVQASDKTVVLLSVKNSESCPGESGSSAGAGSSNESLGIGDTWTDGDFNITLNGVRTLSMSAFDAAPDYDFLLLFDLSIENLTDEEQSISSLLSFDILGSSGYSYDIDIFADTKGSLDGSIRPGKVLRGEIAFDVEELDSYELEVRPSFFGESAYFEVLLSEIE